ncbi:hypothetical protein DBV15_06777 [Temnothorax longispinosus]|uniref:Uncharacterized protein n=1 Tax=Temnothorax longispinosus TaxID=300112 RepID=A0A4S2KZ55_9HYME|nr:hypothetical protein DBV15_06777 [Temnothorax longispinosus]
MELDGISTPFMTDEFKTIGPWFMFITPPLDKSFIFLKLTNRQIATANIISPLRDKQLIASVGIRRYTMQLGLSSSYNVLRIFWPKLPFPYTGRGHTTDLESPFKNLIYIEEFRRGQTEASIFEAPPFKMHYAGRRSTIGGRDGHEQKGKRKRKRERERVDRTRLRDGERRNDLDGECERNGEQERTERRQKKRDREDGR